MNLKTLLALSLAANLVLAFFAYQNKGTASPPTVAAKDGPTATSHPETKASPSPATVHSTIPSVAASTNAPGKRFDWQSVESADYKEYIANLRAIGCPEETIRDIIVADVNKMFDDKKRQARGGAKKFEFWKTGNPMMGMGSTEDLQKAVEIDKEREATLRNMGIEPDLRTQMSSMMNPIESMFDFVPESKRAELIKAMTSAQESFANTSGQPDMKDVMKMQQEMEQKVKALLTPEEALQYDLRMSITANTMRMQLGGFDPNEDEFMKVFQLKKGFDDQFNPLMRMDEKEADRKAREAAEEALNEKLKQTLGDTRYADYERSQDFTFQQLLKSAKRGDADTAQAIQAWDLKKTAEQKANELRSQPNLAEAQRDAALRAIQQETETALKTTLGEKAWQEYNTPMNAGWLQHMAPAAAKSK